MLNKIFTRLFYLFICIHLLYHIYYNFNSAKHCNRVSKNNSCSRNNSFYYI